MNTVMEKSFLGQSLSQGSRALQKQVRAECGSLQARVFRVRSRSIRASYPEEDQPEIVDSIQYAQKPR